MNEAAKDEDEVEVEVEENARQAGRANEAKVKPRARHCLPQSVRQVEACFSPSPLSISSLSNHPPAKLAAAAAARH